MTKGDREKSQPRPDRRAEVLSLLCVVAAASFFFSPYFRHWDRVNPQDDWLQHAARHAAVRISLTELGQFPLRTHFFGGGYPTLWNPEDPTLSPFVALTFVFGEIAGVKLIGLALHLAGVVGVYLLARGVYGQSRWAAGVAACVLAFSSWTSTRVYKGNINELYFLCFPLMLWLLTKARNRASFVCLTLVAASLAMDGKLTWFSMMFFLGLGALRLCSASKGQPGMHLRGAPEDDEIPSSARSPDRAPVGGGGQETASDASGRSLWSPDQSDRMSWSGDHDEHRRACFSGQLDLTPLLRFVAVILLAVMLAAPKLLSVAEMFASRGGLGGAEIARHGDYYGPDTIEALSPLDLWHVFTRPVVGADFAPSPDNVSLPVVLLACGGLVLGGWRLWRDVLIAVLALFLVTAYHAPIDVFRAFTTLPGFSAVSVPAKYFDFYLLLFLAIMAGQCVEFVHRRARASRRAAVKVGMCVIVLGVLGYEFCQNRPLVSGLFTEGLPTISDRAASFHQVRGIRMKTTGQRTLHSNNYLNLLRRVGTIDQFTAIPLPAYAEPRFFVDPQDRLHASSRYRGEAYLLDGKGAVEVRVTPNRIRVRYQASEPATIVINQNFDRYWRANVGRPHANGGLLAVRVPEGAGDVDLWYSPTSFQVGLGIMLVAVAVLAVAAVVTPRWRLVLALGRPAVAWGLRGTAAGILAAVIVWIGLVVAPTMRRDRWFLSGLFASRRGEHETAARQFSRVLAERPHQVAALRECGQCLFDAGDYGRAIELLGRAAKMRPRSVRTIRGLATAQIRNGDLRAATATLSRGVSVCPFSDQLHLALAKCYAMLARPGLAMTALARAIDLGCRDWVEIASEPAFKALRGSPEFRQLMDSKRKQRLLF